LNSGITGWDNTPDSFGDFHRNANRYCKEIEEATKIKDHMSMYGLKSMASCADKSIEEMKLKMAADSFCGFNKISLVMASVILAKMSGHTMDQSSLYYTSTRICADVDFLKSSGVFYDFDKTKVDYMPVAYTFTELNSTASEDMKKLIEHLESFPPLGNKPLFDHYRILVPSVNYPFEPCKYRFKEDSEEVVCDVLNDAKHKIDCIFVKRKLMTSILLGERDGDHYFICYWR
jgi:hypothetical protein